MFEILTLQRGEVVHYFFIYWREPERERQTERETEKHPDRYIQILRDKKESDTLRKKEQDRRSKNRKTEKLKDLKIETTNDMRTKERRKILRTKIKKTDRKYPQKEQIKEYKCTKIHKEKRKQNKI